MSAMKLDLALTKAVAYGKQPLSATVDTGTSPSDGNAVGEIYVSRLAVANAGLFRFTAR